MARKNVVVQDMLNKDSGFKHKILWKHFKVHKQIFYLFFFSMINLLLWRRKWQPTPAFLPGESQGWGLTESDTTEVTSAATCC